MIFLGVDSQFRHDFQAIQLDSNAPENLRPARSACNCFDVFAFLKDIVEQRDVSTQQREERYENA